MLFPIKSGVIVDRVTGQCPCRRRCVVALTEGETLGIVGESGCGKTTLIRALVRLMTSTGVRSASAGQDITKRLAQAAEPIRREMQMVFQDPQASLNPRKRVGADPRDAAADPRRAEDADRGESRASCSPRVGPVDRSTSTASRTSSPAASASGSGSRARWRSTPKLILLDEPVSALDVSIQAQVINLLEELQDELHSRYVFVAHDLSVVRHVRTGSSSCTSAS